MSARLAPHPDSRATRRPRGGRARGLTLIELAVSVAIVAVVASIAIPAYRSNIELTERAEAQVEVRELEMKIERYFQIQGFYPATLAEVGDAAPLDPWGNPYQYLRLQDPPPSSRARADAAAAAAAARTGAGSGGSTGGDGGTSSDGGGTTAAASSTDTAASSGRGGSAGARGAAAASSSTSGGSTAGGESSTGGSTAGGTSTGGSSSTGGSARGQARKDHNLVPINTDFDLYSMGPDGQTAPPLTAAMSRDDIVRGNNGRYIGDAANY